MEQDPLFSIVSQIDLWGDYDINPFTIKRNTINALKKGDPVKLTWGCYENYEGIVVKNLKYKLRIITNQNVVKDLDKDYIRTIGSFLECI